MPKTSRRSVLRRKLDEKLDLYLRHIAHQGVDTGNGASTSSTRSPLLDKPSDPREQVDSNRLPTTEMGGNHAGVTGAVLNGAAGPSSGCPTGATPPGGSDTIPPRPQIRLALNTQAKLTVTEGSRDVNLITPAVAVLVAPSEPVPVQTAGPSNDPANTEKKRKGGDNIASAAKKQKVTGTNALAEPTNANTIRNACMHDWNAKQRGGQGLAADFNTYFKALSDTDKEPFKTESRTAQSAARKAKAASKKTNDAPLDN